MQANALFALFLSIPKEEVSWARIDFLYKEKEK